MLVWLLLIVFAPLSAGLAATLVCWGKIKRRPERERIWVDGGYKEDILIWTVGTLMCAVALGWLVSIGVGELKEKEPEYVEQFRFDVVATQDGSLNEGSVSGGLFIFSGYFNEVPTYFFYRKSNGGFRQGHIPANRLTTIYEDSTEGTAYISKHAVPKSDGHPWIYFDGDTEPELWEIHVPEGSVIRDFRFDLE